MREVVYSYSVKPITTANCDWRASFFDGDEEGDKSGHGPTKLAAAIDLWQHCEMPEDMLAVVVAVLRAELENAEKRHADWPAAHANLYRIAFESAIRTVEGIA